MILVVGGVAALVLAVWVVVRGASGDSARQAADAEREAQRVLAEKAPEPAQLPVRKGSSEFVAPR